jgi:hypothetical protein
VRKALWFGGAMLMLAGYSLAADPIRVMLLDGESGGPYHQWKLVTPVLQKQLEETGLFKVNVVTVPAGGECGGASRPRECSRHAEHLYARAQVGSRSRRMV